MIDRLADFNSNFCVLNVTGGRGVVHTFGRQAIPMWWDFAESIPFNETGANWQACIDAAVGTEHKTTRWDASSLSPAESISTR